MAWGVAYSLGLGSGPCRLAMRAQACLRVPRPARAAKAARTGHNLILSIGLKKAPPSSNHLEKGHEFQHLFSFHLLRQALRACILFGCVGLPLIKGKACTCLIILVYFL